MRKVGKLREKEPKTAFEREGDVLDRLLAVLDRALLKESAQSSEVGRGLEDAVRQSPGAEVADTIED